MLLLLWLYHQCSETNKFFYFNVDLKVVSKHFERGVNGFVNGVTYDKNGNFLTPLKKSWRHRGKNKAQNALPGFSQGEIIRFPKKFLCRIRNCFFSSVLFLEFV